MDVSGSSFASLLLIVANISKKQQDLVIKVTTSQTVEIKIFGLQWRCYVRQNPLAKTRRHIKS